jgi:magnesium transporter
MREVYSISRHDKTIKKIENPVFEDVLKDKDVFLWVHSEISEGIEIDSAFINSLETVFGIHELTIEDCLAKKHPPKVEIFENYLFFILSKMENSKGNGIEPNKVSIIIGDNFIITFADTSVQEIQILKSFMESSPQDFNSPSDIFYVLSDKIVDNYLAIVDKYSLKIDRIENMLFEKPESHNVSRNINFLRKNLIILKRNVLLEKEIFFDLSTGVININNPKLNVFFKDIYDHIDRVLSKIDLQKEYLTGILNVQLALNSQKLNSLVKFLTIISAVLLPATLIAGIFGMNFADMPLLNDPNGFCYSILSMFILAVLTILFFYKKRWI